MTIKNPKMRKRYKIDISKYRNNTPRLKAIFERLIGKGYCFLASKRFTDFKQIENETPLSSIAYLVFGYGECDRVVSFISIYDKNYPEAYLSLTYDTECNMVEVQPKTFEDISLNAFIKLNPYDVIPWYGWKKPVVLRKRRSTKKKTVK